MTGTSLRILRLSISAFRGIPGNIELDLSSPLTLLYAPNGTGKTSFIDAAEWLLTDQIRRMEKSEGKGAVAVRCKFSPGESQTVVSAELELDGRRCSIFKTPEKWLLNGAGTTLKTEKAVLAALAPHAVDTSAASLTAAKIRKAWLRSTRFLTESDLSILVETDPEIREERRQILSELMGVRELEYRAGEFRKFAEHLTNGLQGEKGIAILAREAAAKKRNLERTTAAYQAMGPGGAAAAPSLGEVIREKESEEIRGLQQRLTRLRTARKAAEDAVQVFNEQSRDYCHWQREMLSDAMFSIFGRIHANETFSLIREGPEDDPFEWVAMAAEGDFIPSREFSMGQRQDLALSIFLAKARGVGGTFFLDEPMIRLDDLNRVALLDMFRVLVTEEGTTVHLVITTASRALVRHFQEKFVNIPERNNVPVLKVVELEGSPRDGVKVAEAQ